MSPVYVVQHVHVFDEDREDVKFIGVHTTERNGQEAVARLRLQPGFKNRPDGFSIDRYELDTDHWTEAYVTVTY